MKRFLVLLLAASLLISCEDVIPVDLPKGEALLVVEGAVTDQPGPYTVELTKTRPYFDEAAPARVTGAVLTLQDDQGQRETLRETAPGTYRTNGTVRGRSGGRYVLTIDSEGQQYRAETEIRRTPEIDGLQAEFREEAPPLRDGYFILYFGEEPAGVGDYYRFKVYRNGKLFNRPSDLIVSSDEFVDGNYIDGLELSSDQGEDDEDRYKPGDVVRVEANSISRDYFYFLNEMVTQINNGGLFASPPANVRTNVRNLTSSDPTKAAVGYFAGYTVRQDSVVIQ